MPLPGIGLLRPQNGLHSGQNWKLPLKTEKLPIFISVLPFAELPRGSCQECKRIKPMYNFFLKCTFDVSAAPKVAPCTSCCAAKHSGMLPVVDWMQNRMAADSFK